MRLGSESQGVAHEREDSNRQHGHRPSALLTASLLTNHVLEEDRMSDLVVIAFPTEAKAEEVRQKLLAMQKEYLLELGDAVVAVKDEKGNIKLNQMINTTAAGAVGGAFWGTLIGLIFLMPLAGAALGAASGAVSGALTDLGISDKFMKETAAAIQPGTAALFVLCAEGYR
jgi:uncharacterized membrane protein